MRVMWVMKNYGAGGAERLLLEMGPYMQGVDISVVAVHLGNNELLEPFREAGFEPRVLADSPVDPRWVFELRRLIRTEKPDLVHAHLPVPGIGARIASLGLRAPIIYTEHNVWESYVPPTRWGNAFTLGLNDMVVAVSDEVRRSILRSRVGRRWGGRVVTIANGIDPARVRSDSRMSVKSGTARSFGAVMSLIRPAKGPDVLVEAAAALRTEFPDHRCVIVGDGGSMAQVRTLARELGVESSIDFLGRRMDARAVMANLEVVVLPSRREGLPFVLLEAMALGRPIVAAAVGGIPAVIQDGVNGLLVPAGNPQALADAIARFLRDPGMRARLGSAALDTVEKHWTIRQTADRYRDLYQEQLHPSYPTRK